MIVHVITSVDRELGLVTVNGHDATIDDDGDEYSVGDRVLFFPAGELIPERVGHYYGLYSVRFDTDTVLALHGPWRVGADLSAVL